MGSDCCLLLWTGMPRCRREQGHHRLEDQHLSMAKCRSLYVLDPYGPYGPCDKQPHVRTPKKMSTGPTMQCLKWMWILNVQGALDVFFLHGCYLLFLWALLPLGVSDASWCL